MHMSLQTTAVRRANDSYTLNRLFGCASQANQLSILHALVLRFSSGAVLMIAALKLVLEGLVKSWQGPTSTSSEQNYRSMAFVRGQTLINDIKAEGSAFLDHGS